MSEDSIDQWQQATGASPLNNWHPVFHTLCIRALIIIYESPAIVALAQIIFLAGIASGSLLWLTLALAKRSSGFYLIGALLAVALFRHNGLVVYALVLPFCKRKEALISLVLLVGFKITVTDRVIPNSPAVKLIAPVHGMAAVMYHSKLPADVQKKMEEIMPLRQWHEQFSDYSVGGYLFNTDRAFLNGIERMGAAEVLRMYDKTFLSQLSLVIKERLNGTNYLWSFAPVGNRKYITYIKANDLGLRQRENNLLRTWLEGYLALSEKLCWQVGMFTLLLVLAMFKARSRRPLLVFLPWLGCTLSLIPSMVDQEYRYVYFVFFLFGFLCFTLLTKKL